MENNNQPHVIVPLKEHTHTVILLHGRDSTATEFTEEFFESQASDDRTLPEMFPVAALQVLRPYMKFGLYSSRLLVIQLS